MIHFLCPSSSIKAIKDALWVQVAFYISSFFLFAERIKNMVAIYIYKVKDNNDMYGKVLIGGEGKGKL